MGGFDKITDCFADLTPHIHAVETGLSSDPLMNWRLAQLDDYILVTNSDAHSLPNLGREANILELEALSYANIIRAIRNSSPKQLANSEPPTPNRIVSTIEFYPEEGMYHYDGHRACNVRLEPSETRAHGGTCPRCRLPLTVGVLHRVEALADRPAGFRPPGAPDFVSLVELDKIIAEGLGVSSRSAKSVQEVYERLIREGGSELAVLLDCPIEALRRLASAAVVEGIRRVRERTLTVEPGFDGQYGRVRIFSDEAERQKFAGGVQAALSFSS
jgi:uncharacterized protein (TIGR00375 family)